MTLKRVQRGEPITAQWANSLTDAVEYLLRLTGQAPIVVQRQAGAPTIALSGSLARLDLVELSQDIEANEVDRDAHVLQFEPVASGDKWPASARDLLESVVDAQSGLHLQGQRMMAFYHPAAGKHMLWPAVQFHLAKTDAAISAGGSGAVSVWEVDGASHADSGKNVVAHDWAGQGLEADEAVLVFQHLQAPRRWYAMRPAAAGLIRFELTASLALGGSANAKKLAWNGSAYAVTGGAITVRDFTSPGSFSGASGDQGWAVRMPDRGDFEIVFLETAVGRVRVNALDPPAYLEDQLRDVNGSAQYSSGADIPVEWDKETISGDDKKLRGFVDISAISGYDGAKTQVLGHQNGTLKFFGVAACS